MDDTGVPGVQREGKGLDVVCGVNVGRGLGLGEQGGHVHLVCPM